MDRSNTYVAMSRHKEKATIFVNKEDIESQTTNPPLSCGEPDKLISDLSTLMNRDNGRRIAYEHLMIEEKPALTLLN